LSVLREECLERVERGALLEGSLDKEPHSEDSQRGTVSGQSLNQLTFSSSLNQLKTHLNTERPQHLSQPQHTQRKPLISLVYDALGY